MITNMNLSLTLLDIQNSNWHYFKELAMDFNMAYIRTALQLKAIAFKI
jgi:hypothetical protein